MRVAVLGAGGTIAPAIVRDLAESDEASSLLLLDLDLERAEAVAERHGRAKATAARTDARASSTDPASLTAQLANADVLVNAASYRVNLHAMRACLEAGSHYLDLGGLYHVTAQQLELADEFERAGLLAILGIGSAPGKTNLMAAVAKRELGGSVDALHAAAAGRDLEPPDGFSVPYALRTILDELTLPPVVIQSGEAAEIEPLASGGEVDFGDPIGAAETIYTLHSEMLTFGSSFGCSEGSFRLSLSPAVLERVRALDDASDEEIDAAAREALPPSPTTVSVHLIEATGGDRDVRVRAVTGPIEEWGLGGGVVSTAAPAAAAVRLMARGSVDARGVLPPELCLDPDEMFTELEKRGCRFEVGTAQEVRQ
jgi:lysine 6-dehydrogenase